MKSRSYSHGAKVLIAAQGLAVSAERVSILIKRHIEFLKENEGLFHPPNSSTMGAISSPWAASPLGCRFRQSGTRPHLKAATLIKGWLPSCGYIVVSKDAEEGR